MSERIVPCPVASSSVVVFGAFLIGLGWGLIVDHAFAGMFIGFGGGLVLDGFRRAVRRRGL